MRTAWILGLVALAAGVAAWWAFRSDAQVVDVGSEDAAERSAVAETGHVLAGRAAPASSTTVDTVSYAALTGTVRRGGVPTAARVELRRAGGPGGAPRWRMRGIRPDLFVAIGSREDEPAALARAGDDGRFAVARLSCGTYEARAIAADDAEGFALLDIGPHDATATLDVEILGGPEVLRGRAVHGDGRPFAGVVVAQPYREVDWDDYADLAGSATGTTDDEGRFTLRGLTSGPWMLSVLQPGRWRSILRMWRLPYAGEVRLEVDVGQHEVLGRVLAAATERPVPGARVSIESGTLPTWSTHALATTDDQGRFRAWTSKSQFQMRVEAAGFSPVWRDVKQALDEVVVRMPPPSAAEGRVVEAASGRAVPGARVHCLVLGELHLETHSDADGRFVFPEAPVWPAVQVFVLGGGWASQGLERLGDDEVEPFTYAFLPGETSRLELRVVPAGRLVGRVVHADGRPAARATVECSTPDGALPALRCAAGADGAFELVDLVPGAEHEILARTPETDYAREDVTLARDRETSVELRLPAARRIEVRVTSRGKPLAGATVMLYVPDEEEDAGADAEYDDFDIRGLGVPTGPDGVAILSAVPDGRLCVGAIARNHAPSGPVPVAGTVDADGVVREEIVLEPGTSLTGRVTLSDGSSPEGTWVTYSTRSLEILSQVGPDGTFSFEGVLIEEGSVRGTLYRGGVRYSGDTDLDPADRTLSADIELRANGEEEPGPFFTVRVVGPSGERVPTGRLQAWRRERGRESWTEVSDTSWQEGAARVSLGDEDREGLWLGASDAADEYGHVLGLAPTAVGPLGAEDGEVVLRMEPGHEISGRVLGPDGEPGRGFRVGAMPILDADDARAPLGSGVQVSADGSGAFRFRGLGPSDHRLSVVAPSGVAEGTTARVSAGDTGVVLATRAARASRCTSGTPPGSRFGGPRSPGTALAPPRARARRPTSSPPLPGA